MLNIKKRLHTLTIALTIGLFSYMFVGCSTGAIQYITNSVTTIAKIGTSTYKVAKVFYVSGRTILVSGGIYELLPKETQAKLKALDTTLVQYDVFRTKVIDIIETEVGKGNYVIEESGQKVIIAKPLEREN